MKKIIIIGFCLISFLAKSQVIKTPDCFDDWSLLAQIVSVYSGIPASVQLAQGYCETGFGTADTIGKIYHNVFSIMDTPYDHWKWGSGPMCDPSDSITYQWRWYSHPVIAWIDYAFFIIEYFPGNLRHRWKYWCDHPIKYGHSKYWEKIRQTIEEFELYKYDVW